MAEKRVTIDLVFSLEKDGLNGLTHVDFNRVDLIGSGLSKEQVHQWSERFLQSDYAFLNFPIDIVECIETQIKSDV